MDVNMDVNFFRVEKGLNFRGKNRTEGKIQFPEC